MGIDPICGCNPDHFPDLQTRLWRRLRGCSVPLCRHDYSVSAGTQALQSKFSETCHPPVDPKNFEITHSPSKSCFPSWFLSTWPTNRILILEIADPPTGSSQVPFSRSKRFQTCLLLPYFAWAKSTSHQLGWMKPGEK